MVRGSSQRKYTRTGVVKMDIKQSQLAGHGTNRSKQKFGQMHPAIQSWVHLLSLWTWEITLELLFSYDLTEAALNNGAGLDFYWKGGIQNFEEELQQCNEADKALIIPNSYNTKVDIVFGRCLVLSAWAPEFSFRNSRCPTVGSLTGPGSMTTLCATTSGSFLVSKDPIMSATPKIPPILELPATLLEKPDWSLINKSPAKLYMSRESLVRAEYDRSQVLARERELEAR
ncbi:hypothetical protein B0H34DRAFT_676998 [Crassisporium funariophilum]|nr:hypothetical protein B0H34DRAFT_676998 [Crassisporium funariophilum]